MAPQSRFVIYLRLFLLLLSFVLFPSSVQAQGGRVRYMEIGVTLDTPAGYQALPIPRSANSLQLLYVRRQKSTGLPINFSLYLFPGKSEGESTLDGFLGSVLKAKALAKPTRTKSVGQYVRLSVPYEREGRRGWLFAYVGEEAVYFLVGEAPAALFEDEARLWKRLSNELRFHPPARDDRKRSALERKYGRTRFSGKQRRIFAHLSMVEGWSAYDSDEYIYLVHGEDTQAWKGFDRQLSGVRRYLTEHVLSHRNQAPKDVGVIRLCHDRQEYLDYGGMDWTAGYFSPQEDQLVIYDPGNEAAMLSVLRHESFHQYIYAALGGISPHIWFDEGYAELMASAKLDQQRVVGFDPIAGHMITLTEMLGEGGKGLESLGVFLHLSQQQFYAAPREYYAQAWIWIEFLMNSEYGQRSSRGEDFIKRYIRSIREGWQARVEAVPSGMPLTLESLVEVRELALAKALKKFDLKAAEPAFLRFVKARIAGQGK